MNNMGISEANVAFTVFTGVVDVSVTSMLLGDNLTMPETIRPLSLKDIVSPS